MYWLLISFLRLSKTRKSCFVICGSCVRRDDIFAGCKNLTFIKSYGVLHIDPVALSKLKFWEVFDPHLETKKIFTGRCGCCSRLKIIKEETA